MVNSFLYYSIRSPQGDLLSGSNQTEMNESEIMEIAMNISDETDIQFSELEIIIRPSNKMQKQ